MTRERDEALRREGRADAAILLTARRVVPHLRDLAGWADDLDLEQSDIRDAIARARARLTIPLHRGAIVKPKAPSATADGMRVCTHPGCTSGVDGGPARYRDARGLGSHLLSHAPKIDCPKGCGRKVSPKGVGPHTRFCDGTPAA